MFFDKYYIVCIGYGLYWIYLDTAILLYFWSLVNFFITCNILIIFLRINFYQGILLLEDFIKVLLNYSHYSYTNHNPPSSE